MKLFIQKWLGIIDSNSALYEIEGILERIRDLESKCYSLEDDFENFEYTQSDIDSRVDELESVDFDDLKYDLKSEIDSLKEEVNEVLSDFESMTEGYTVSVKLNPPL